MRSRVPEHAPFLKSPVTTGPKELVFVDQVYIQDRGYRYLEIHSIKISENEKICVL